KGIGLFAANGFNEGDVVGEYVGDVMPAVEDAERPQTPSVGATRSDRHCYFMRLGKGDVIDASRRGGLTRFLNHSCAPNAEAQNWTVGGEMRVAIIAKCTIPRGAEVTFDYSWGSSRARRKPEDVAPDCRCLCGADDCRGELGDR
ncbi:hypothetical protein M885DRAFT_424943, partial [Pelagophyceae sp. CCMP2097]